jgi:hypothetical protein
VTTIDWVYDQLGRLTEERYDATGTANDYIGVKKGSGVFFIDGRLGMG